MVYVALLRGINVGGNNKVDMKQLKNAFEATGMRSVKTHINSGNVIFASDIQDHAALAKKLEAQIESTFGFKVKVLVRDIKNIETVVNALPDIWQNNADMKCDVMFLWEHIDTPDVMTQLTIKPEIDEVKYVAGTILWRADRQNVTRSGLMKLAGSELYKYMTIRNCNTARKLLTLMKETADV